MKYLITILTLVSQNSMAIKIVSASRDNKSQKVVVNLAYQGGCMPHEFSIEWDACTVEGRRQGVVVDTGAADPCMNDQFQAFSVAEPEDGCEASEFVLKSSTSKNLVVISK